jgi:hypothetical protein
VRQEGRQDDGQVSCPNAEFLAGRIESETRKFE